MEDLEWIKITTVSGELNADIIKGMLEANDIPVQLIQESAGRVYGIVFGRLGNVQIFIPKEKYEIAKSLLDDYSAGSFPDANQ